MIALPIGFILIIIGAYDAVSFIFLTLLPILIILTKVPSGKDDASSVPTQADKVATKVSKIIGGLLLFYLLVCLLLALGMMGG